MRGLEAGYDLMSYLAESLRDQFDEGLWVNLSPSFYKFGLKEKRCGFSGPVVVSVFPIAPLLKNCRNLVCVVHCLLVLKWVFPRATRRITPLGSRKNNFPCLSVDPSRLAALLVPSIRGVCAVLAPCQTGVSAPKQGKLFLREPFHYSHCLVLKLAPTDWPFWVKNVTGLRKRP